MIEKDIPSHHLIVDVIETEHTYVPIVSEKDNHRIQPSDTTIQPNDHNNSNQQTLEQQQPKTTMKNPTVGRKR